MSLEVLSSADAVNAAMDEYDALGGPAFLRKYGFGQARGYFVARNGKLYDSKAIVGAAVGKQHPDLGPLRSADFSGGEATVKAKLEELGFEVVGATPAAAPSPGKFAELVREFLSQFAEARQTPFGEVKDLWATMEALAVDLRRRPSLRSRPNVLVKWSLGKGVWAKVPWIALLNSKVTTSTQGGLYAVFLVAEDLSSLNLTLNQGMTDLVEEFGQSGAVAEMRRRAEDYRRRSPQLSQAGFRLDGAIDLHTAGWRSKNYEVGTIAWVDMPVDSIPSDELLDTYLEALLSAYDALVEEAPPASSRPCWLVGASWDAEDQTDRFLAEGVWENGYETGPTLNEVRLIEPGDQIAIKASFTKKHGLPFPYPAGETVSMLRIKAVGVVTENLGDGRRLRVDWKPPEQPRDWYFFTNRNTIWRLQRGEPSADRLIDFTFNGAAQDYAWFLKQSPLSAPRPVSPPEVLDPYLVDDALKDLFLEREEFERILEVWRVKQNLVLQGAPGVGKTFVARRLAYALMGERAKARVGAVQFHQSYGYEDFVQGYRPTSTGGFELRNGVFHRFCELARTQPDKDYVFIIDEINRGNLSKIFGELMLLIESDKRDEEWATHLAYSSPSDPAFFVPDNVFVLGMMNTADRSLSMVDYALRRRFAFVPLRPAYQSAGFRDYLVQAGAPDSLIRRIVDGMTALNDAIATDKSNLGPGFQIGHSFFIQPSGASFSPAWFERVVETEIRPLIEEYWFDDPDKAADWRERLLSA
jgi:5-methylcytosine-specific restriction protein B